MRNPVSIRPLPALYADALMYAENARKGRVEGERTRLMGTADLYDSTGGRWLLEIYEARTVAVWLIRKPRGSKIQGSGVLTRRKGQRHCTAILAAILGDASGKGLYPAILLTLREVLGCPLWGDTQQTKQVQKIWKQLATSTRGRGANLQYIID